MSLELPPSGASLDLMPSPLGEAAHAFDAPEPERLASGGLLGRGGLGEVRSAHDERLRREVAVKVAHRPGTAAERRLVQEAWITARLEHPGIVPVYDAGRHPDGALYYTMRRVRGLTLADALRRCASLRERLRLVKRVHAACEAVAFAHSRGVVHRDLKPANVLLGDYGETLVADWGLACFVPGRRPADLPPQSGAAASAGVGTPGYMAPEQERGAAPAPPADVFSLGRMLAEIVGEGPAELRSIVARAVAPEPGDRYPDAHALGQDVERWLEGQVVDAHRYSTFERLRRFARAWALVLGVAALGLAGITAAVAAGAATTARERDRSQVAEARAIEERGRAEDNLARVLVARSLQAAEQGRRAEAELAALGALTTRESPDARGVLARFDVEARPVLLRRDPLPRCDDARVDPQGTVRLCLDGRGVVAHALADPAQSVRAPLDGFAVADAAKLGGGGGVLFVSRADDRQAEALWWWDGADQVRWLGEPPLLTGLSAAPDAPWALQIAHGQFFRLGPRGASVRMKRPCWPGVAVSGAAGPEGLGVLACNDGRVVVFAHGEVQPREAYALPPDVGTPIALAWSRGGSRQRLLVGTIEGWVVVLELGSAEPLVRVRNGTRAVRGLAGRDDLLAVVGEDGRAVVWEPHRAAVLTSLPGHAVAVRMLDDGVLRIVQREGVEDWSLPPVESASSITTSSGVGGMAPLGQGRIAVAHGDGQLRQFGARGRQVASVSLGSGVVKDVALSPAGSLAVAAISRPGVVMLDPETLDEQAFLPGVRCRRVLTAGPSLVAALPYGPGPRLLRHDAEAPSGWVELPEAPVDPELVDGATFPDGRGAWMLSGSGRTWSVLDGEPPRVEPGPQVVGARSIAGDEARVVVGTRGALVTMNRDGSGAREVSVDSAVFDVAVSGDRGLVATGHLDGTVEVRDAQTLQLRMVLRGHEARVSAVRFDPDGRRLWSGAWDGTVRAWSLDPLDADAAVLHAQVERAWGRSLRELLD